MEEVNFNILKHPINVKKKKGHGTENAFFFIRFCKFILIFFIISYKVIRSILSCLTHIIKRLTFQKVGIERKNVPGSSLNETL